MNIFLILIGSVVVAFLIGILIILSSLLRRSRHDNDASRGAFEERVRILEASSERLLREQREHYERQIMLLEERLDHRQQEIEERMERRSSDMQRQSAIQFNSLASEALGRERDRLNELNKSELDALLAPLQSRLTEFRQAIDNSYMKENSSREALRAQVESLIKANAEIGRETRRLSESLRGNAVLQGQWGEIVLQRLLEKSGLSRDVHFIMQCGSVDGEAIRNEEGTLLRPDCLLLLPGGEKVVIDAKTSLTWFIRYSEAGSEEEGETALRRHVSSVRSHIEELGAKQYHRHIPCAMEHTLMFMPNDASYLAALRGEPSLCEEAMKHNVVIVSPAHLMTVIQLISQIWRVENQNRNAEAIAREGGRLYDKFVGFASDFEAVGKYLRSAENAFEKCNRHIVSPGVGLVARTERLREMGAKVSKRIPSRLTEPQLSGSESEQGRKDRS